MVLFEAAAQKGVVEGTEVVVVIRAEWMGVAAILAVVEKLAAENLAVVTAAKVVGSSPLVGPSPVAEPSLVVRPLVPGSL